MEHTASQPARQHSLKIKLKPQVEGRSLLILAMTTQYAEATMTEKQGKTGHFPHPYPAEDLADPQLR